MIESFLHSFVVFVGLVVLVVFYLITEEIASARRGATEAI